MTRVLLLLLVLGVSACSSTPRTHTETPSLKYARKYVSDAKDYNDRARRTNEEIDIEIRKLLEEAQ